MLCPLSLSGGRGDFQLLPDGFLFPAGPAFPHPPLARHGLGSLHCRAPSPGGVPSCHPLPQSWLCSSRKARLEALPSPLLLRQHVEPLPASAPIELGAIKTWCDLLLLLRDPSR